MFEGVTGSPVIFVAGSDVGQEELAIRISL